MGCQRYVIMQNAVLATGNGTALECSTVEDTLAWAALQVTIAGTATVTFEGTVDGTNWLPLSAHALAQTTATTDVATATASGLYRVRVSGLDSIRARVSAWTSGAVTVAGRAVSE